MEEEKPKPGKALNPALLALAGLILAGATFAALKYSGYFPADRPGQAAPVFPAKPSSQPRAKAEPGRADQTPLQLQVAGSPEFKKSVGLALFLLWKNDQEAFGFIKKHVQVIRRAAKTDFSAENGVPTVFLTDTTALYSPSWCAGAIAHQAFHSYLYYGSRPGLTAKTAPPAPGSKAAPVRGLSVTQVEYTGFSDTIRLEREADRFQLAVMKNMRAPRAEIKLLENREDADFSLIHDGR